METQIEKVECWVLRAPIAEPVANAFGAMTNRPAVFLRVSASDGAWGWGEVFSNFPQVGAEHRARLVASIFAPLLAGVAADDPAPVRALLDRRTRQMAIQCGEPGPFAQITGAVDQALWDLAARRAGVPLWRHLGGGNRVRVYASGIGPERVAEVAARATCGRPSCVQAEGRLRCAARCREPRGDARGARRRCDDHVRRQPGVDGGRRRGAHRRAGAASSALDRGADRRRRAARSVGIAGRARWHSARRRRKSARTTGVRRGDRGRIPRVRPAGRRQVGRHQRRTGRRAARRRARHRVLPALARRRRRARGVDARAGRRAAASMAMPRSMPIPIRCARKCFR